MTVVPITSIFVAAACAGLVLLSFPIANSRRRQKLSLGHGDDVGLQRRIRAQANFIEYVPLALLALALIELAGGDRLWVWVFGGTLAVARLSHAHGLIADVLPTRALGAILTFLVLLGEAVRLAVLASASL